MIPLSVSKHRDAKKWDYIYDLNNEIDILFLGSSHIFTAFNPNIIDSLTNLKSFNLGSNGQIINQTYYNLVEVLKYRNPSTIVLDVNTLIKETNSSAFIFQNLSGMNLSVNKLISFLNTIKNDRLINIALFTKERFNWKRLKLYYKTGFIPGNGVHFLLGQYKKIRWDTEFKNFEYNPNYNIEYRGYVGKKSNLSEDSFKTGLKNMIYNEVPYNFNIENLKYLNKIINLCEKNKINLILIKSPTIDYEGLNKYINKELISNYIEKYNIEYYNMTLFFDKLGLINNDFHNKTHLSINGSEKVSKLFSKFYDRDF